MIFIYCLQATENSTAHDIYNFDIFQKIENEISYYQDRGTVYAFGDSNARVGRKSDFIRNDHILSMIDESEIDISLPRNTSDLKGNRFGDLLLDICKSRGLRICNGRLNT